jgi:hypothetical protein
LKLQPYRLIYFTSSYYLISLFLYLLCFFDCSVLKSIKCQICGRMGHIEAKCWTKFLEMRADREAKYDFYKKNNDKKENLVEKNENDIKKHQDYALMATNDSEGGRVDEWVVDSGCLHHMVNDGKLLSNVKIYNGTEKVADRSDMQITGVGSLIGTSEVEGVSQRVRLNEVFVVSRLTKSLLPVKRMMKQGC